MPKKKDGTEKDKRTTKIRNSLIPIPLYIKTSISDRSTFLCIYSWVLRRLNLIFNLCLHPLKGVFFFREEFLELREDALFGDLNGFLLLKIRGRRDEDLREDDLFGVLNGFLLLKIRGRRDEDLDLPNLTPSRFKAL
jgi:hypothetical protein